MSTRALLIACLAISMAVWNPVGIFVFVLLITWHHLGLAQTD